MHRYSNDSRNDKAVLPRIAAMALSFISFLYGSLTAAAQSDDMHRSLGDVTVTAQRPLSRIGTQVTPIDSAALRYNISQSMADVIGYNSSVFVKSAGRATLATVAFRGTAPSHTAVTWNGLPLNSPSLGMTDFSMLPSYFIDRTTLLNGASSLTRTSAGMGGLVEMASSAADIPGGFSAQYVQGVGSFGTFDEFIRLAYGNDRWRFSTRAVMSTSDNDFSFVNHDRKKFVYDENHQIVDSYYPKEKNRNGDFSDFQLLQQIYFTPSSAHDFGLQVWYTGSDRNVPLNTVDYVSAGSFLKKQRDNILRAVGSWMMRHGAWRLNARMAYVHQWDAYDYAVEQSEGVMSSKTAARTKLNTFFSDADWSMTLRGNLLLSASVNVRRDNVSTVDHAALAGVSAYDKGRTDIGASVSVNWQPLPRLGLSAIVREDIAGGDADAPVPAMFADYVVYRPANLILKASVARNHHFPTINDMYFLPGGNPDLRAEHGFNYEVGASMSKTLASGLTVSASASWYDSHISDWILWLPTVNGFFQARNVKSVHSYGVEGSMSAEAALPCGVNLSVNGNAAWTASVNHGEPLSPNDKSVGRQLPYVPEFTATATASIAWRLWTLRYKFCHYSRRNTMTAADNTLGSHLPAYSMSDASIERRVPFRKFEMAVKLAVSNLFDADYQTIMSRPMPGTNFEAFISISF